MTSANVGTKNLVVVDSRGRASLGEFAADQLFLANKMPDGSIVLQPCRVVLGRDFPAVLDVQTPGGHEFKKVSGATVLVADETGVIPTRDQQEAEVVIVNGEVVKNRYGAVPAPDKE